MYSETQVQELRVYLDANPGTYSALDDQATADTLNTPSETRIRASMSGSELWENTDPTEYNAITDAQVRNEWLNLCGIAEIATTNQSPAAPILERIFGNPSTTRDNLLAARQETVSPATDNGWPAARENDVTRARAL